MGDCPEEYLEFVDTESEMLEQYETKTSERVVMPDGRLLTPWDEEFKVRDGPFSTRSEVPPDLERRQVPFKELFATFEQFAREWHGAEGRDPEKKRYGYWENPNAKWDWYLIGGRWSGFFLPKAGASGEVGSPSWGNETTSGRVDRIRKGDVDFETLYAEAERKARDEADIVRSLVGDQPIPAWPDYLAKREAEGVSIDAVRKEYNDIPAVRTLNEAPALRDRLFFDDPGSRYFGGDLERFVRTRRLGAIVTHAVLLDGKWYERGKMGWWACVSNPSADWPEKFAELLAGLPDDALLTVVDCHI